MINTLVFNKPFSGYTSTDFISCFSSTYMYLENLSGIDDYDCKKRDGLPCDGCGNCRGSTAHVLEDIYFLFDTLSGRSSLRGRFDGGPTETEERIYKRGGTDSTIDFLFGFAGYAYRKVTEPACFRDAVGASIDAGRPVLVRIKTENETETNCFRVVTGCDGDALSGPDYDGAQNRPARAPFFHELDELYVIGVKTEPRFTLKDGLERIRDVMAYNARAGLWDGYVEKLGYFGGGGLQNAELEELRRRLQRVSDTMWHTFNCHNFAETFRHRITAELRDPALDGALKRIDAAYDDTHTRAWSLIGLNEWRDWSKRRYDELEWGMCELAILTLKQIRQNDLEVLSAVSEALSLLQRRQ